MANVSNEWAREYVILSSRIAEQLMLAHELQGLVTLIDKYPAKFTAGEIHAEVEKILDESAARFGEYIVSEDMETLTEITVGEFEARGEGGSYDEF